MRFDSYISLLRFLQVVCGMGYIPPAFNLEQLKLKLPGRINYYTVKLYLSINELLLSIEFIKDGVLVYEIACIKEKK